MLDEPAVVSSVDLTSVPEADREATPRSSRVGERGRDRHAVVERHLEKYPWSRLSDERGDQAQLQLLLDRAGAAGAAWSVTPPPDDRLPGPFDADLYIALATVYNTQIPMDQRASHRTIVTSLGELAEVMGRERGGSTYAAIRNGLRRLRRTEVRAVRTFREGEVVAEERVFSVIGEYSFQYRRDGDRAKTGVSIEFPKTIADSIARGHFRLLNVGEYFSLESPTARKLYRYLDAKRWRGSTPMSSLAMPLQVLANELPIDREAPSHIKRTLTPAHEQLLALGFLSRAEFIPRASRGKRPVWEVHYEFALRDRGRAVETGEPAGRPVADLSATTDEDTARQDLLQEVLETLDDAHSMAFHIRVVKRLPLEVVRGILGSVAADLREQRISRDTARKFFTAGVKRRAKELDVAL